MSWYIVIYFSPVAHTEYDMLEKHMFPLFFSVLILTLTTHFYKLNLLGNLTFKKYKNTPEYHNQHENEQNSK